jgi:eukaryotic-like serine/threonine-protein kinase
VLASSSTQKAVEQPAQEATKSAAEFATVALDQIADRVDALIAAWQGDDLPPDLTQFLPAEPATLRYLVLTELIKVDLEYRWQHQSLPKQVEEYVEDFPELNKNGELPWDLIYEEFRIRRQSESPATPEEYFARFPRQADQLRRVMKIEGNQLITTTIVGPSRSADVEVGQQIDDFDLLVRLGKGSFGTVFLARQKSMQRLVALKISRDRGVEPQTLAQLDHPNIVRVYDQRVLADRKLQLMYMQHIPGGTLADVVEEARKQAPALRCGRTLLAAVDKALDERGESPPAESSARRKLATMSWAETICWVGARLAAALDYAHSRGVLHRDIKPANVLLSADGAPKLVDFNVSFSSKLEGATAAAYFGGSLVYMSPEQIDAYNPDHDRKPDELDGRSDTFSLGVVLWELLTGSRPFTEDHLEDCVGNQTLLLARLAERRRAGVPPNAIAALPTELPPSLKQLLLSCLSPNPADRPATGAILGRQLELCLQPRVQRLLRPAPKSWRQRIQSWPFVPFVIFGLIPSAVLSYANLKFNGIAIMEQTKSNPAVIDCFNNAQVPIINGVSFPIAVILVLRFAWPPLIAARRIGKGATIGSSEAALARRRCLWVGDYAAWVGMALWIISGVAFPLWLQLRFGAGDGIGLRLYQGFLASQIACGWISSTLTFFLLTFMFIHAFYPLLIRPEEQRPEDVEKLYRLDRRSSRYIYLAVCAPFFALTMLTLSGVSGQAAAYQNFWLFMLSLIGALTCGISFYLLQIIRADLAALAVAIDPSRDSSTVGTESVDSLWTGTR